MYILIVNEDPLGRALAAALVENGHEVAYLDESAEYCNMVASELGCLVVQGETTNIRMLQEAGIERADVLVTLLEKDIKNIMVGLFARQFGVPRLYARLRQQHYRSAYDLAGIMNVVTAFDHLLTGLVTAIENPAVRHVMALGDGKIEIAGVSIHEGSPFIGKTINAVWEHKDFPSGALVLGVLKAKQQEFFLARGVQELDQDDEVLVAASHEDIQQLARIIRGQRRRFLG
jgi:trk system potassium uptake protein TrkA